jgi:cation transport ATPase
MKKTYNIEVDCANCALLMENATKQTAGVENAVVNFMTQKMTLEYDEDNEKKLFKEIQKTIKKIEPDTSVVFE